jgi:hypothetical protein
MKKNGTGIRVIFLIVWGVLNWLAPQDAFAQIATNIEKPGQDYFTVNNDIKCYQMVYDRNGKDYVTYSEAVRERIKQKIRNNYSRYYNEGDVNCSFIIRCDGKLLEFSIDRKISTADKKLIDVVLLSLKGSSPFPPFPKTLSAGELPFSVTISFKER